MIFYSKGNIYEVNRMPNILVANWMPIERDNFNFKWCYNSNELTFHVRKLVAQNRFGWSRNINLYTKITIASFCQSFCLTIHYISCSCPWNFYLISKCRHLCSDKSFLSIIMLIFCFSFYNIYEIGHLR